ncbi:MAG: hypothetical protein AVO33_05420 [delta proteobacterium ML8_F1]|nr:MAG: hypothetical protein AVO33_05420 [delta proteobacterium ML8_F1]
MKDNRAKKDTGVTKNTTAKVISLLFAIVFWTYVMDQVNPEMTKEFNNVTVEVIGAETLENQSLVLLSQENYSVGVEVRGRRGDIIGFSKEDLKLTADITGYTAGTNTIPIEKASLVENVTISNLSKPDIKVELDRLISVAKPIEVEETGTLTPGYQLSDIIKSREEIVVSGAESFVSRVETLKGTVNIEKITEDFETEITLIPVDFEGNEVRGVNLSSNTIQIGYEAFRLKTLPVIATFEGEIDENYLLSEVSVNPPSVVVKGKPENVSSLVEIVLEPIDIAGATEDFTLEVPLNLPGGVSLPYNANLVGITAKVDLIETKEMLFDIGEVAIVNLPGDFEMKILEAPENLGVTLLDTGENLEGINRTEIELVLDLEGLAPGEYNQPIALNLLSEVHGYRLSQETIAIEIIEKEE